MVCLFSYENNITHANQAQGGCGMGQNTVSQPNPLQTQRQLFWRIWVNGKLIRRSLDTHALAAIEI